MNKLPMVTTSNTIALPMPESTASAGLLPFRVYQVELCSHCNLKCSYCPHPNMERPKGYMSAEVLGASIQRIKDLGGTYIVLHHFGEPLLHPELSDRLKQIADSGLDIQFSTNAVLLETAFDELIGLGTPITIMVAVHKWVNKPIENYLDAMEKFKNRSIGTQVKIVQAYNVKNNQYEFHNWASGENLDWNVDSCPFIKYNLAVILWNGDIASCCVDHEGATVRRNILEDNALTHRSMHWHACATCDVGRIMQYEDFSDEIQARNSIEKH